MLIHGFSGAVHLYKYNTVQIGIRVLYSTAPDTFQSSPATSPLQVPYSPSQDRRLPFVLPPDQA
ncbi:unnamed protein product [Tuber melanosporum]|uniref:(Perigord truffle) hypothetical protein n=1 Tax=Tuber melanosporum (strain Mel28) TaxID=656061 RepID=D5G4C1_TUBMM|nr:uncharacterized protein GSTUM_00004043001 [Tuber melanosporum]CAZ79364.1 unnamed protein product [Tuber melanosporum]